MPTAVLYDGKGMKVKRMPKPKKYALTERERDFAGQNHNLIYSFLHKNHLEISEFYDSAAFGFLRAVAKYHRTPGLREKYEFYVIAWTDMRRDVWNEIDSRRRRESHIAYSLDESTEDGTPFSEFLADSRDAFWEAEQELELQRMLELLRDGISARQEQVVLAKLLGCKRRDIVRGHSISISAYKNDMVAIRNAAAARLECLRVS